MKRLLFPLTLFMVTFFFFNEKSIAQKADEETILGSGTMNYIPVFTGTYEIGNSIIYSSGGNIGIGDLSPTVKLSVGGIVRVKNSLNSYLQVGAYSSSNNFGIVSSAGQINGTGLKFQTTNGSSTTNGIDRVTILNDGNVGIGTTSPGAKLDINGTLRTNNTISLVSGSTTYLNLTSGVSYFNGGNVGIGVTSPMARLAINQGTNSVGLRIEGLPTYEADIMLTDGVATAHIKQTSTGNLVLETDGGDIILNASVGIGTLTPNTSYKLDVVGRVRANEVVVNTTGADFVFQENYNLRSLSEVETFIKENKHLPEIPNAEEMQQNGMSLSEMNTKLLQKVEELTLYIIDQEKRIKNLEDEK